MKGLNYSYGYKGKDKYSYQRRSTDNSLGSIDGVPTNLEEEALKFLRDK